MSTYDQGDSSTTLNTALNKSMILMDSRINLKNKITTRKSIKINTKIQPPNPSGETLETARRSILKKSQNPEISEHLDSLSISESYSDLRLESRQSIQNYTPRPRNLEDFLKEEDSVILDPKHSTFNSADLSDSEEVWVMEIPKTVNPRKLSGQTLLLGKKSKIKVGSERYCAVSRNNGCCLTWVLHTGRDNKPYKAVNITPAGSVTVRRKLHGISRQATDFLDASTVPFPSNLKVRNPLFGPSDDRDETTLCTKMAKK